MTNIVIPIAGSGSRYSAAGHELPRFLVDVDGLSLAQRIVWGSGIGGKTIYVVQAEHNKKYNLSEVLPTYTPALEVVIVEVDQVLDGPAASALAAKEYIDNDDLLVVCDSDGIIEWEPNTFLLDAGEGRALDGSIAVFSSESARGAVVSLDDNGLVTGVAEAGSKNDGACAGVYYWRYGRDFVKYAEKMIEDGVKVNNEFNLAYVYNEAIKDEKVVGVYPVNSFSPISEPSELEAYIASIKPSEQ